MDHSPFTGRAIEVSKLAPLVDTRKENGEQIVREDVSFVYRAVYREKAREVLNLISPRTGREGV